jgi:5'-3' exonuclease
VVQLLERSQVVGYMALVGDSSDTYPGVPGIGPVKAAALLQTFGSVEGILGNLQHVTPERTRRLLQEGLQLLHVSQDLAQIRTAAPVRQELLQPGGLLLKGMLLSAA